MTQQPILTLGQRIGIDPEERVCISYYNDTTKWTPLHIPLKLADSLAESLADKGQNVYLMVNKTKDKLSSPRGTADDIVQLRAVFADLDVKDGGLPSWEAARNVIDNLTAVLNCQPTVIVMSGHGLQPYWEVEDGEIHEGNAMYVRGLLKRWGMLVQRFAEVEGGKADNVYDLPRVLRAPGTVNWKSSEDPVPVTMEVNEWTHPVSLVEVAEAVETYGFVNDLVTVESFDKVVSAPEDWEPAEADCMWSQLVGTQIRDSQPTARHPWLLAMAVTIESMARFGCITEDTYGALVSQLEARFMLLIGTGKDARALAPGEVNTAFKWARARVSTFSDVKLRDAVGNHSHKAQLMAVPDLPFESAHEPKQTGEVSGGTGVAVTEGNLAKELVPIVLDDEAFSYTDTGNAERLAKMALGQYIYVPGLGWHVWDDGRYVRDEANSIIQLGIDSVRRFAEADVSKPAMQWALKSLGGGALAAAVRLAETVPELVVPTTRLDAEPLVLCTPGGIVNLVTGHLRPATPEADFHTRRTAVTPQFGPMPQFEHFLDTVLGYDRKNAVERIRYVQELFGVALIGELRWQILPIFSGPGANGKSVLLDVMAKTLGTYAATMPENFLLESGKIEHSTEIFRLRGVRLAVASETRPDGKFNESRVKALTGDPTLSGRAMRQDFVDFPNTFTMFLALNHPPQVKSGGESFWRRVKKVDFGYIVPEDQRNPNLANELFEAEGPAILQWAIEGAQRVLRDGLIDPLSITMATAGYRAEEDHVDLFLQDCTAPSPEAGFTNTQLYGAYVGWCKRNGELPVTQVSLLRDLKTRMQLEPYRNKRERGYLGLIIFDDAFEPAGQPPVAFKKGDD